MYAATRGDAVQRVREEAAELQAEVEDAVETEMEVHAEEEFF
jgi:hypothetical protein